MDEPTRNENILKAVNYELLVFANSLVPSKEFREVANKTFQKVTECIRKDDAFSVNRSMVAGSFGKKTSVLFPDIDAVVFLNHNKHQHPLTDEIEAIMDLLKIKANEFGIIPSSIKNTSKTVKVVFYNGMEMDLLPACQFSQKVYEQYRAVIDRIEPYQENFNMYSSSLAEIQRQFLRDQNAASHQLILILKYWFKLTVDVEIHGGSYLMEVIGVVACNETTTNRSLIENFKRALQKVANIDSLKIAFLIDDKLHWTLLQTYQQFEEHKNQFSQLILQRSNFIIDPSNPFNDLFNPKNLTATVVTQLKECAEEMLRRVELLDSIESNDLKTVSTTIDSITGYPSVKLFIDKIFEPHAMSLHNKYEKLPDEIVIHVDFKYENLSKSIDPKSPSFFVDNKEAKKVSKTILSNLLFLIRGKVRILVKNRTKDEGLVKRYVFANGITSVAKVDDVREAVDTFLKQNNFKVRNSSATKEHENCDVTLYVPYTCNDNNFALRFSMKWEEKLGEENEVSKENKVLKVTNWCTKFALASLSIGVITMVVIVGRSRFFCN